MITEPELIIIEQRAHALRKTMKYVCQVAGKHPSSWYRARKRGRAEYSLIVPIEKALKDMEFMDKI